MAINPFGGPASPFVNNKFQAFQSQSDFDRMRLNAFNNYGRAYRKEAGDLFTRSGKNVTYNTQGISNFNNRVFGSPNSNLDWQSIQTWSPAYRNLLEMSLLEKIRGPKTTNEAGKTINNKAYWAAPVTLANPFGTY